MTIVQDADSVTLEAKQLPEVMSQIAVFAAPTLQSPVVSVHCTVSVTCSARQSPVTKLHVQVLACPQSACERMGKRVKVMVL